MPWYVASDTGGFFQTSFITWCLALLSCLAHHRLQLREILLAEFVAAQRVGAIVVVLEPAELHAADLAGDRLRQFLDQLDAADALERRQPHPQTPEDRHE